MNKIIYQLTEIVLNLVEEVNALKGIYQNNISPINKCRIIKLPIKQNSKEKETE